MARRLPATSQIVSRHVVAARLIDCRVSVNGSVVLGDPVRIIQKIYRHLTTMTTSGAFLRLVAVLAVLTVFNFVAVAQTVNKDVKNKKVERTIDLVSQLAKVQTRVTLENEGKTSVSAFLYAVEPSAKKNLAFIGASISGGDDKGKTTLQVKPVIVKDHKDVAFWEIVLSKPLEAGRSVVVEVDTVFAHQLRPHPSHVTQGERQLVVFAGNLHHYSPYATTSQTTSLVLGSSNIESFTKTKPFTNSDSNINYGPYENAAPFSQSELSVHFENNNPFLNVISLERTIEVSHWGNVAVEELVHVAHTGAILKGSFSRYEYQREQGASSSVKSFKTVLPAAASDVYYRDEIGNISTSHLRVLEDAVEVDLRPRFPLFGGWKTQYLLGYNLPSYEYLFNNGDDYTLKIRFIDHIFDDMLVNEATVRIILPEGAQDRRLEVPYDVQRLPDLLHYTYLDTSGRPVIVARKKNLVENHIQDLTLHYRYRKLLMLQEPLLVIVAFYLLFLLVIIYVRLDFSISKDKKSEKRLLVSSHCERIQNYQDRIGASFQQLDTALTNFKSSKDISSFQDANKKLSAEQKSSLQSIQDLQVKLKADAAAADSAEKVAEIMKHNKSLKDLYAQNVTLTERLVAGKVKKEMYLDNQQQFNRKKDDLIEKIDAILLTL